MEVVGVVMEGYESGGSGYGGNVVVTFYSFLERTDPELDAKVEAIDPKRGEQGYNCSVLVCYWLIESWSLGGEFLARNYHQRTIYIPLPTWGNHAKLFPLAGLSMKMYRCYDPPIGGVNFQGLLEDLSSAPLGAIVLLLHVCAHSPTGVDPTLEQWEQIRQLMRSKRMLPIFDSAYQAHLATGVTLSSRLECLLSQD
ncbi:hypothetical protein Vadar_026962 [Vaccinium darrowii]|uniref:Uncharacterized protein n=1 Tax=Vaccinium darrowii TaxID=229202 RepID=A0ACB7XCY0_9ERIC|nr:hypothetical protein Vadar_026962 [Vaccinium darrowii]